MCMRVSNLQSGAFAPKFLKKNTNFNSKQNTNDLSVSSSDNPIKHKASSSLLNVYYINSNSNSNIKSKLSFKGQPWSLDIRYLNVPLIGQLSSEDAIKIYEEFKCGNYLDIGEDKTSFGYNNYMRKKNLSFLDRVTNTEEKRRFIDYFKDLTGFPNLYDVSEKIKTEFVSAVGKSSEKLNSDNYTNRFDVLQAGYDGICSVGRHKALPGSDLDKAYVIIRGSGYDDVDTELVNKFKGELWFNTDQRILSYNHDDAAFPQVYTITQLKKLLKAADEKTESMGLIRRYRPLSDIIWGSSLCPEYKEKKTAKYNELKSLTESYHEDYVEGSRFFIELCRQFPRGEAGVLDVNQPTRENIKNIGFVLEALREGIYFTNFSKLDYTDLYKSTTYNLTNMSQLKALKNRNDVKPKRVARENLKNDFNSWGIDKQFRFVKTLIEASCANNRNFTDEFPEYFRMSGNDPFGPMIRAMMR